MNSEASNWLVAQAEYTRGLRELADFIEAHEDAITERPEVARAILRLVQVRMREASTAVARILSPYHRSSLA